MEKNPKDSLSRPISTRARSLVAYMLDSEKWEWHEQTGTDHGTDMIIEFVENEQFKNKKIEIQIKGTKKPKRIKNGDITFDLSVKTINYALGSSIAFILCLVDVTEEKVYYLPIQDYFIANPDKFDSVENNKSTVTVHIASDNILNNDTEELCEIAKSVYVDGPGKKLKRIR
jgi:hypothetical protein